MATSNGDRPVLMTTAHPGVFFGFANDTDGEMIRLERARLVVYWSADVQGFMGLGANEVDLPDRPPATITLGTSPA